MINLKLETGPTQEPVTLAQAKAQLRLEADFTLDDDYISTLIVAARELAEIKAKGVFLSQTWSMTIDAFPTNGGYWNKNNRYNFGSVDWFPQTNQGEIVLPRGPAQSITSIQYLDPSGTSQTLGPSVYTLVTGSPPRLGVKYGQIWPVVTPQIGAVKITWVAGVASAANVPERAKLAMKLMIGAWYENREAVTPGEVRVLPMAVDSLLKSLNWGAYA